MADEKNTVVADTQDGSATDVNVSESTEKAAPEKKDAGNDEQLSSIIENKVSEKLEGIKGLFTEKEKKLKAEIAGLNRKNTELQKENRGFKEKELTEEEKFKLREQELIEKERVIWAREAITELPFQLEEEDKTMFLNYLHGDTEEAVNDAVKFYKELFTKHLQVGIEAGVNDRIKTGYRPVGTTQATATNDLSGMSRSELVAQARKVAAMPSGDEKSKLLLELNKAQNRLFKEGG